MSVSAYYKQQVIDNGNAVVFRQHMVIKKNLGGGSKPVPEREYQATYQLRQRGRLEGLQKAGAPTTMRTGESKQMLFN